MPEVIIRRGDDGMEFGIQSADFRRGKYFKKLDGTMVTYEEAGFKVVSNIDGTEYTGTMGEAERAPRAVAASRPEAEPKP